MTITVVNNETNSLITIKDVETVELSNGYSEFGDKESNTYWLLLNNKVALESLSESNIRRLAVDISTKISVNNHYMITLDAGNRYIMEPYNPDKLKL